MSKQGRKSKYEPRFATTLAKLADNPLSIVGRNGKISDSKVASLFDVSAETVRKWRTLVPGRESEFKPKFAQAFAKCQESIDQDGIERSMVEKAKGFESRKRVRELTNVGPQIPNLSSLSKGMLIEQARTVLEMELDAEKSLGDLQCLVKQELQKRKKLKLVTVKEEMTTVAGDVAAAKLVLKNIGNEDDRWNVSEQQELDAKVKVTELGKLINEIGGTKPVLPCDEDES